MFLGVSAFGHSHQYFKEELLDFLSFPLRWGKKVGAVGKRGVGIDIRIGFRCTYDFQLAAMSLFILDGL